MSPAQRLQLVQRVTDEKKRQHARRLAQTRTRVAECEAKLKELQGYHASYAREFDHDPRTPLYKRDAPIVAGEPLMYTGAAESSNEAWVR